jgi:predicted membrane chloride channel (bestrophin family)
VPERTPARRGWPTARNRPEASPDQTGVDLENPFSAERVGHLPLDELTTKIEANLLALLGEEPTAQPTPGHPAV